MIEKLTVAEYSKRTGKTKQSIYKRVNKGTLKSVEEIYNGKKTTFIILGEDKPQGDELTPQVKPQGDELTPQIKPQGDELTPQIKPQGDELTPQVKPQGDELNRDNQPTDNQTDNPQSTDAYLRIIEILNEQLKEKDKQIENLQTLNNQLSAIALRAQELEARTQALLGEPKEQAPIDEEPDEEEEPINAEEPEQNEVEQPTNAEEPKKRGFWAWLLDL